MEIVIKNRNIDLKTTMRRYIYERSKSVLSGAHNYVTNISMYLADINGPKGGEDKQCKLVINFKNRPPLIISERQANLNKAINNALHRADYAIKQRVKKYCKKIKNNNREELLYLSEAQLN